MIDDEIAEAMLSVANTNAALIDMVVLICMAFRDAQPDKAALLKQTLQNATNQQKHEATAEFSVLAERVVQILSGDGEVHLLSLKKSLQPDQECQSQARGKLQNALSVIRGGKAC